MKKIFSALIGLVILTSTAFSQKIPVEGWLGPGKAKESIECSESWKDSGKRTHYFVCKAPGEITLYGEGFGFKAKQEADWGLSIFDELINGRIFSLFPKKEKFKLGYRILDCAAPSITISGALSPPIATNDKCIGFDKITPIKKIN